MNHFRERSVSVGRSRMEGRATEIWHEAKFRERDNDEKNDIHDVNDNDEDDNESVDSSVKEDMKRLEDTFTGISRRFRLINRIGEGRLSLQIVFLGVG